jgi:hypothetical protein
MQKQVEKYNNNFMSKRNFILLIIILIIALIAIFGFLYFQPKTTTPGATTGTNFLSQFNPFGNSTVKPPVVTPPVDVSGYTPPTETPASNSKLIKISSMPVAGYTVYSKERLKVVPIVSSVLTTPTDTSTTAPVVISKPKTTKTTAPLTEFMPALRYVDRTTGNIYETFADKINEQKFSATIIPKIYEAFLGSGGESVIMRYLKTDGRTIETFFGNTPKESLSTSVDGTAQVKGSFLPEDIKDASLSPDASSLFYLFNSGDNMIGATMNLTTGKKTQIFDSPFTEWLSDWPNTKIITLTTKPASGTPGYMYKMDTGGKNFTKILSGINGLTTLGSPDGKLVLYSDDTLSLYVYHMDTKVSDLLGVKTLPEKCVWSSGNTAIYCTVPKSIAGGTYPDSWYQGEISFSDQIWKIDIKTGNTTMLIDPITISGGADIDGTKLMLDTGENYLFFVNKKDSYLWEFALK